ncbi:hypothetical protein D3C77_788320 [compost metagenome]
MAFVFSSLGLFTSCWFVMGLMGMSFNLAGIMQFWASFKDVFIDVMSQNPTAFPLP